MKTTLVPTKETCQALQEAGFDIGSKFYWVKDVPGAQYHQWDLFSDQYFVSERDLREEYEYVSAPLLSELLAVMPDGIHDKVVLTKDVDGYYGKPQYIAWYEDTIDPDVDKPKVNQAYKNPAEAAASLMLWLAENNHVNPGNDHEQE